jgi:TRAP-type mannitol/chloroaromatic compound transport system permease small subunit
MPDTHRMPSSFLIALIDKILASLCAVASFMAMPLALLLFAQWPLRELLQAYSREANDVGQIVFAFYVAVAVTAASRGHVHLASFKPSHQGPHRPRWHAWAVLVCTAPWAIFMLWAGWPLIAGSLASLERFGETLTPGYFLIKLAMGWMVLLILLEGIARLIPLHTPGNMP